VSDQKVVVDKGKITEWRVRPREVASPHVSGVRAPGRRGRPGRERCATCRGSRR
jgi:hypothetical protein